MVAMARPSSLPSFMEGPCYGFPGKVKDVTAVQTLSVIQERTVNVRSNNILELLTSRCIQLQ